MLTLPLLLKVMAQRLVAVLLSSLFRHHIRCRLFTWRVTLYTIFPLCATVSLKFFVESSLWLCLFLGNDGVLYRRTCLRLLIFSLFVATGGK